MTLYALDPLRSSRHRDARAARELADWLAWMELGGTAPSTLDAYERTCADLLNAFPDTAYADFTDGDILQLLMTYPERSRRTRKAHLGSWFKWGSKTRRLGPLGNPIDPLPTIKAKHQPVENYFTPAEVAALCALPSPDGPLALLLFEAGLRLAEAVNLRARRIDFEGRQVIVKEGAKGSRDRVAPMVKPLAVAMADLFLLEGLNPDDHLWYDRPGGKIASVSRRSKPIAATSFRRWWAKCCEAADVDYRRPHLARHTCASTWNARGLPIEKIQKLLGHASITTTMNLYVHTGSAALADEMDALYEASR